MHIKVKIGLRDAAGAPFMGAGAAELLRGVEASGSLRVAAGGMGMSYSKAHRLVKTLEAALGYRALERARGGSTRGGSALTPRGRRFLERYEDLYEDIRSHAAAALRRAFPGGRP